ncbi:RagB/SusD family nutrient uptake outer membrane protein [Larkinella insperata]|uniref:RagB/SusD family nutrient uptake outer membrane protein n=1 Tax=Larkinella insperata TaxID=332158 RepID=A0ABW3QJG3_9BACT|nr:RagB/SusD family nutrient uptake outer membrane protein [Larkinella insperata]
MNLTRLFFLIAALSLAGCKLDVTNPNGPTDEQVLNTRDGMITLSIGMRQFYSTSGLESLILTTGTTAREVKGITTFTNILELEAGGTGLPTFNGNVLSLWLRLLRVMGMAEDLQANAPTVLAGEPALRSGVLAHANLFKAMALGGLATAFEQLPLQTNRTGQATFSDRKAAVAEAIRLLDEALALVTATPPSTVFTSQVAGPDFDLINTIQAYRARYNLVAGNYTAALTAANAVNLTARSQFVYNTQSPNPVYQQVQISANYAPRDNFGLPATLVEATDARRTFYLTTPDKTVNGEPLKTLRGFFDAIDRPIPVYLPDEVRLIRAEALVRSNGDLTAAVADINAVRTQTTGDPFGVYAGLPAYSGPVTAEALLQEIYRQRGAELFLTGQRLEDSRRFGRPAPPANLTERNRNFYPYPDQERLTNPNTPADPVV